MWGKKDPEEEFKDQARKRKIPRPRRSYCEACKADFGTPVGLLAHIKKVHS
jgi:hypothetical protein